MRFGVMLPHYRHVADPDGIIRIAEEAEAMGFHSVWVSDHVVVPDDMVERFGRGYYDMFTVLGYVASVTKRVQLGTSIVIMPLASPAAHGAGCCDCGPAIQGEAHSRCGCGCGQAGIRVFERFVGGQGCDNRRGNSGAATCVDGGPGEL